MVQSIQAILVDRKTSQQSSSAIEMIIYSQSNVYIDFKRSGRLILLYCVYLGEQELTDVLARLKMTLWPAKLSRFGVRHRWFPYAPISKPASSA